MNRAGRNFSRLLPFAALAVLAGVGGVRADDPPARAQLEEDGPRVDVAPPRLNLRREDVDLQNCTVRWSINRRAQRGLIELRGLRGDLMHSREIPFEDARPNARLEISWPSQTEQIGKIEVTTWDEHDASVTFVISPFRIEIDHEDVVFESGRWEIREDEGHKLDAAWEKIAEAMNDYGSLLRANLYVAGFTDTVGQPRDNQRLSEQRALAIANYFKEKGMEFPIHARGFGEHCLAEPTPDNTDCERNRRAAYILAVDPPILCPEAGGGGWQRIR